MRFLLPALCALCLPLTAAELKFETMLREFKVAPDAEKVVAEFPFKNESKETVEILNYSASCSCITASIKPADKLKYAPGEGGVIRAEFELSALAGTIDKAVQLRLNGDKEDEPSVNLISRITIPELVSVEPKTLTWFSGEEAKPKTVTVTMHYDKPIHVLSLSSADDNRFTQELKTVEDGKKYEILVTPKNTETLSMGVIHIQTDCELKRHAAQRLFTVVRKPVASAAATQPQQP